MSVIVRIPLGLFILDLTVANETLAGIAKAAGKMMNLELASPHAGSGAGVNSVDLDVGNVDKVGVGVGNSMVFHGNGVTVEFRQDASGNTGVTVHGDRSEDELREIGQKLANSIVQQYAYHRLVTEMKERGMNIVEEEVEEDGTVHMRVRVYQG